MAWSFRLMNDAGTLNLPLKIRSRVDNRYIGRPLSEKIPETWDLLIDEADWATMESTYTALSKAMYDAERAIRLADEPRYVWLESTRPDTTKRRTLIYSGSFGTLEIKNTDTFDLCSANVVWSFERHPLAEAVTPLSFDIEGYYANAANGNNSHAIFVQSASDITPPSFDGTIMVFPTEAPGRIAEFTVQNTGNAAECGDMAMGWAGIHPTPIPYTGDDSGLTSGLDFNKSNTFFRPNGTTNGAPANFSSGTNSQAGFTEAEWLLRQSVNFRPVFRGRYHFLISVELNSGASEAVLEVALEAGNKLNLQGNKLLVDNGKDQLLDLGVISIPPLGPENNDTDQLVDLYYYLDSENASASFGLQASMKFVPADHYINWTGGILKNVNPDDLSSYAAGESRMSNFVRPTESSWGASYSLNQIKAEHGIDSSNWVIPPGVSHLAIFAQNEDANGVPFISEAVAATGDRPDIHIVAYPRYYSL